MLTQKHFNEGQWQKNWNYPECASNILLFSINSKLFKVIKSNTFATPKIHYLTINFNYIYENKNLNNEYKITLKKIISNENSPHNLVLEYRKVINQWECVWITMQALKLYHFKFIFHLFCGSLHCVGNVLNMKVQSRLLYIILAIVIEPLMVKIPKFIITKNFRLKKIIDSNYVMHTIAKSQIIEC